MACCAYSWNTARHRFLNVKGFSVLLTLVSLQYFNVVPFILNVTVRKLRHFWVVREPVDSLI